MRKVFKENPDVDAVIHFADYSLVAESMEKPLKYFDNNTSGMVKLLEVMNECGVKYIVFSSTAATYGIPEEIPILETTPQNLINPYGESKLMMETIMKWSDQAYGIKYVPLRYFNVAGTPLLRGGHPLSRMDVHSHEHWYHLEYCSRLQKS